ncbi:PIR Superfamily Protein [Plasmodium ovale wallikeri]|uniref:PIR Superfamily Protein n=1 Tax=Plasmodium ovale wallikeri TaxID=864142 RepID=A0A1A9AJ11_PLAOA|nr:PIR Superfamily Protein [Plasmodium ovale wallikeri]
MYKAVAEKTCEPREFRISEFTFSDNRAIILILFALWGIFLSFLFLYKLTPFRQYLFSKIKMIKNNLVTVGKSENELLLYSHDYDNIILDEADYNISYYTVRNS